MCQYLPIGNFEWNNDKWTIDDIMKLDDEGEKGYIFEVDLEYPEELHDLHNVYALAPENMAIKNNMLNHHQRLGRKDTNIEKLATSFYDKIKYGVNY